jgi:VWFA-related protein
LYCYLKTLCFPWRLCGKFFFKNIARKVAKRRKLILILYLGGVQKMKKYILFFVIAFSLGGIILGQSVKENVSESGNKILINFSESKPFQAQKPNLNPKSITVQKNTPPIKNSDDDIIKIDSSLVTIPVSVSNSRNGFYVSDLAKEEFKIFEDGTEQKIAYFGNFDKPFTVILVLDTSPSTEYRIEEIQEAARAFVNQLKPQDLVEVIKFNEKIRVLAKATRKRDKIYKAIEKARFDSGTSLYDVVDFALRERLREVQGRKAIVLFTDGVDTTSEDAFFEDTLRQAERSDTVIFPIYYDTSPDSMGSSKKIRKKNRVLKDYRFGKMYLDKLATLTGGRIISPDATPNGLNAAFKAIAEELSYQYNIGYYPTKEGVPGQRKNVKVRVYRPDLNVRARDNYIVKGAKPVSSEQ